MKKPRRQKRIRQSNPADKFTVMVVNLGDGKPVPCEVPTDLLPKSMRLGFDLIVDDGLKRPKGGLKKSTTKAKERAARERELAAKQIDLLL